LKLLLDEMYSRALADGLAAAGIDVATVSELGLAGSSDRDLFAAAIAHGYTVLTENVADFTCISAEHLTSGGGHPGLLIALSSRFSRRRAGVGPLVAAIRGVVDQQLDDRVVYLEHAERP
jgi:hypothetical protein